MSSKLFIASLMFLSASAVYASSGEWTHETRQVGNKVSIDVYHRTPYALTGSMAQEPARRSSGEWTHETRQVGRNTIDVYRR
jgi:hypothetical protein